VYGGGSGNRSSKIAAAEVVVMNVKKPRDERYGAARLRISCIHYGQQNLRNVRIIKS
jgi:hypothetical protein